MHYYARWKLIGDLLPALKKAKEAGEDAKVLSVLAAAKGAEIDEDDIGFKKTYSFIKARTQVLTYNDLMMEVNYSLRYFTKILFIISFIITGICCAKSRSGIYPWIPKTCSNVSCVVFRLANRQNSSYIIVGLGYASSAHTNRVENTCYMAY